MSWASIAPLILLESGYNTWVILEPGYNYDNYLDSSGQDRRYEKVCTVQGTLHEATERLHQMERGRVRSDVV